MPARRTRGDGGLTQRHDAKSCPAPVEVLDPDKGVMVKVRPEHKCRGRWQGTIPVSEGARQKKYVYGRTKEEARMKLREAVQQRDTGSLVVSQLTVETWLWHWLNTIAEVKPQTHSGYASKIRTVLVPNIGHHRLTTLKPEHVRAMWKKVREEPGEKGKPLEEASLRQAHAILARALRVAMQEGKISRNPMDAVKPPSTKTNKRARLTIRQAGTVLEHTDDARWWLALFYGMRKGEVLGLRWCDVDFESGIIHVVQTLQRGTDGKLFFGKPKSDAGERDIPMISLISARMKLLWIEAGRPDLTGTELVFFSRNRRKEIVPRDPAKDWRLWKVLLTQVTKALRADNPDAVAIPDVSLHSARNSAASLMEAAGVPQRLIAQILGHSNVKQTEGYQDADVEEITKALEAGASMLQLSDLDVSGLSEDVVEAELVEDEDDDA